MIDSLGKDVACHVSTCFYCRLWFMAEATTMSFCSEGFANGVTVNFWYHHFRMFTPDYYSIDTDSFLIFVPHLCGYIYMIHFINPIFKNK